MKWLCRPSDHHAPNELEIAQKRLTDALEAVYQQFRQPTPAIIEGCPCCIDTRKTDVLLSVPLRELSGQDLWRYTTGAFLTVGGNSDFRYLLPRIFEIAATPFSDTPGAQIVIGKLGRAGWRQWSSQDQQVIESLLDAWFDFVMMLDLSHTEDWAAADETESFICGAALAGISPMRWKGRLLCDERKPLLQRLRQDFNGRGNGFWKEIPQFYGEFGELLGR